MTLKELVEAGEITKEEAIDWMLWKMQNLGSSGSAIGESEPAPYQEAYRG